VGLFAFVVLVYLILIGPIPLVHRSVHYSDGDSAGACGSGGRFSRHPHDSDIMSLMGVIMMTESWYQQHSDRGVFGNPARAGMGLQQAWWRHASELAAILMTSWPRCWD